MEKTKRLVRGKNYLCYHQPELAPLPVIGGDFRGMRVHLFFSLIVALQSCCGLSIKAIDSLSSSFSVPLLPDALQQFNQGTPIVTNLQRILFGNESSSRFAKQAKTVFETMRSNHSRNGNITTASLCEYVDLKYSEVVNDSIKNTLLGQERITSASYQVMDVLAENRNFCFFYLIYR